MSYIVRVTKKGLTHCPACSQYIRVAADLASTCCDFCGAALRIEVQRAEPTFGSRIQAAGRGALLAGLLAGSTVLSVGCGDARSSSDDDNNAEEAPNNEECDPDVDLECEEIDGGSNISNDYGGGSFENPLPRFVLLEDRSSDGLDGPTPGADIDAIGLDLDGDVVVDEWATSVEEFNIGGANNEHLNTDELLGPPDADCQAQNFTSLGGTSDDNYVIVGFGNGNDATFGAGAIIQVVELGPTSCPEQTEWTDDDVSVFVSVSSGRATFTEIGTIGSGVNAVIIP